MHTVVVTGASGVGKTAAVTALSKRGIAGVQCFYFDEIGVPSTEVMEREHGGGEQWQAWATQTWLDRLDALTSEVHVAVLDGQTRPSFVRAAVAKRTVHIALLDCATSVREARLLHGRQQPELVTVQMMNWAAYLRGQADALGLPVIDTTILSIEEVADRIEALLATLR